MSAFIRKIAQEYRIYKLKNLARKTYNTYLRTLSPSDLEFSVEKYQRLLDHTPKDHPDRARRLQGLATAYGDRHKRTGALEDLELSIQLGQEALDLTPKTNHLDRARRLQNLGVGYNDRSHKTGTLTDVEFSIQLKQEALELTPSNHKERAERLHSVAVGYINRYRLTGALEDLELSIQLDQEALDLTPKTNHRDRGRQLENLGKGYGYRYELTEALDDIALSIQLSQEALDLSPSNRLIRAARLENLGLAYHSRYRRDGAIIDFELCIQRLQEALDLTPEGADRVHRLKNLGLAYRSRYWRDGATTDFELYVQRLQEALDLIPEGLGRVDQLHELGTAYRDRYLQSGVLDNLELSIQLYQQALDLTPDDHPHRARRLAVLGTNYGDRYKGLGAPNDIEISIRYIQQAIDLIPENDPDRALQLSDLGTTYACRYMKSGVPDDIDSAIHLFQEVLNLTPENHPDRLDRLQKLASGYQYRYNQNGALSDLELSIQLSQEALNLTSDNPPDKANRLQALAIEYLYRYYRKEALSDLENAIQLFQETLDLTSENDPNRADRLHYLGEVYKCRYQRDGALSGVARAIQSVGVGHKYRYQRNGQRDGALSDIERVIQSLGGGPLYRYEQNGQRNEALSDLENAIRLFQEALDITSEDNPDRADRLHRLGEVYKYRYEQTGASDDLELSVRRFQEALNHESSPPVDRLLAGRELFETYTITENWRSAYDTASLIVSFIPLLTLRSLERSDIQRQVTKISGLGSDATAAALRAGKSVFEAIQLLEASRSIVANSLGGVRTDIMDLNEKFPDLAEQFNSLRNLLHNPREPKNGQRYNTGKELEELIQTIRSLPGFDRFLLASSEDEMRRAAVRGPIVVVNVSKYGCHALIIEQGGFRALELPLLEMVDIWCKVEELSSPNTESLEWLWDKIACPVLTSLNFVQNPEPTWPRVWWVLTGPLALFPIHAAGRYSEDEGEIHATVMDRVISSYSSSVRAIVDTHRKISVPVNVNSFKEDSMVLVGMRQTPGYSSLQFAQKEIEVLAKIGMSMQLQVKKPLSLQKETLSALSSCKIFHFAGHGYTDSLDASKSALILSDGRLTVNSIFDINSHQNKPFLAYLSACGTGQVKDDVIMDEGLHLIGACQLAGFRHVIGTLWEVNDNSCVDIARMTYEWMQKRGLSDSSVSEGLHHACRALRSRWYQENDRGAASRRGAQLKRSADTAITQEESGSVQVRDPRELTSAEDSPMHWVPYVHFGM